MSKLGKGGVEQGWSVWYAGLQARNRAIRLSVAYIVQEVDVHFSQARQTNTRADSGARESDKQSPGGII